MYTSRWRGPRTRKEAIELCQLACLLGAVVIALIAVASALDVIGRGVLQSRTSTMNFITYHPRYKGRAWTEVDLDGDSQPDTAGSQLPGGLLVSQVHAGERIDL